MNYAVDMKPAPQNIEIEQSILSGCILFDELRQDALSYVSEEDFYKKAHRIIFNAVIAMVEKSEPVELLSLSEHLKAQGKLEEVGGAYYLSKITDVPIPANVKSYADKLKKYAQVRAMIQLCGRTMQTCYELNVENLDELINNFQKNALQCGQDLLIPWKTKEELTLESVDRYQELNRGSKAKALPTGFPTIDILTGGGFRGPKLIIIAARPGIGKTALMCNLVANMARRGIGCGVFSLEMDRTELDDRWIAADAKINSMRLYTEPGPNQNEWSRILEAADRQSDWPVFVDDTGGLNIAEIKRRARQMVRAGAEIIFIDQLSKIGGNRKLDVFTRNSEHVEELAFLKKELRIPIILLAQLNRELEKRHDKKPVLSDLKNTGQLEEDADIVLLGYRPALYLKDAPEWAAEWHVAKHRQGATVNIPMVWNESFVQFFEEAKH